MRDGKTPVIFGDGSQTRDFTHVKDVVRAMQLAMNSDYQGILNVGTGKAYSFNEVVENLNKKLGLSIKPQHVENPIKNYVQNTLSDTTKAKKVLGFEAKWSLEEGIDELLRFYLR
jgi:UDP-glucose 4-epimerase